MTAVERTHRRVTLVGSIAERWGAEWSFAIAATPRPGDVLRAIDANAPGFLAELLAREGRGVQYAFLCGERPIEEAKALAHPIGSCDFTILELPTAGIVWTFPLIMTILSIALTVASLVMSFFMKPPSAEKDTDSTGYGFGGIRHDLNPGDAVPVVYGAPLCGSARLALSVFAEEWGSRNQRALIVDMISEGEIEGWAHPSNPLLDIYLDEVQAVDAVTLTAQLQTGVQNPAPFSSQFEKSATTTNVGVALLRDTEILNDVLGERTRSVRVNLAVTSLQKTNKKGVSGNTLYVDVYLLDALGHTIHRVNKSIGGKIVGRANYSILLEASDAQLASSPRPWRVGVIKTSPDSTATATSDVTWDSYTEIGDYTYSHPWTARVALEFAASEYQSIPIAQYRIKGRKVLVPSNYDPIARHYVGRWDGTFSSAEQWTDNPAWCWLDLATHWRYGLGEWLDVSHHNIWALYQIARYCDAVDENGVYVGVPDGRGNIEPRYTLNVQIRDAGEALRVLMDIASNFAAIPFSGAAGIELMQDAPATPSLHFLPDNIVGGVDGIAYAFASLADRTNRVVVQFQDPDNQDRMGTAVAVDSGSIARLGATIEQSWVVPGCRSRGEAMRHANRLLSQFSAGSQVVRFKTGAQGALMSPGRLFWLTDPFRNGKRNAGLLRDTATYSDHVEYRLDRGVSFDSAKAYMIETYPAPIREERDGVDDDYSFVLARPIAGDDYAHVRCWMSVDAGTTWTSRQANGWAVSTKTLYLVPLAGNGDPALYRFEYRPASQRVPYFGSVVSGVRDVVSGAGYAEVPGTQWVVTESSEEPTLWRCTAAEPDAEAGTWEIGGQAYAPSRYDTIDNDVYIYTPPTSPTIVRGARPLPPESLHLELVVAATADGQTEKPMIRASWAEPPSTLDGAAVIAGYRLSYQRSGDAVMGVAQLVHGTHYDLDVPWGVYTVTVASERYNDGALSVGLTQVIDFGEDDVPRSLARIVRMELLGRRPGDYTWEGREFTIQVGVASDDFNAELQDGDLISDTAELFVKGYQWTFANFTDGTLLSEPILTTERRITITWDTQVYVFRGGPHRRLVVDCVPIDYAGRAGTGLRAVVSNPAPLAPIVTVAPTYDGLLLKLTNIDPATDVRTARVWHAAWNGSHTNPPEEGVGYMDAPVDATVFLPDNYDGAPQAVWIALFDTFGEDVDDLNIVGPLGPYSTQDTVADRQIEANHIATDAVLPEHVKLWLVRSSGVAFPTSPAPSDGDWFYRTDLDKVYKREYGAWVEKTRPTNGLGMPLDVIDDQYVLRLNASKLYAGTIAANLIGARTIAADKLIIGDFQNFALDPTFDLAATATLPVTWQISAYPQYWTVVTTATGLAPKRGAHMARWDGVSAGAGDSIILSPPDFISCSDDDLFSAEVFVAPDRAQSSSYVRLVMEWYDADYAYITRSQAAITPVFGASPDGWTRGVMERMTPIGGARYVRAGVRMMGNSGSIYYVSGFLFRRAVGQAFIEELSADILTSGQIQATTVIEVGNHIELSGVSDAMTVIDNASNERIRIGKDLAGTNYGVEVRKANGDLVFNADGLGVYIVGTSNINPDAVNRRAQYVGAAPLTFTYEYSPPQLVSTATIQYVGSGTVRIYHQSSAFDMLWDTGLGGRASFSVDFRLVRDGAVIRSWAYSWDNFPYSANSGGHSFPSLPDWVERWQWFDTNVGANGPKVYSLYCRSNFGITLADRVLLLEEPVR